MYQELSKEEEELGSIIVNAAFMVHKQLGPGLLEKIYESCFCYELEKLNIPFERQAHLPVKYDCYFDKYHTYIDAVYLKLSHKKNLWIPNTAIHKYDHAITYCGKSNLQLLLQDHDEYWHIFYSNKRTCKMPYFNPIYYRVLTPFSLTSFKSQIKGIVNWEKHLDYLKGYGPWINLPSHFCLYSDLKKLTNDATGKVD